MEEKRLARVPDLEQRPASSVTFTLNEITVTGILSSSSILGSMSELGMQSQSINPANCTGPRFGER